MTALEASAIIAGAFLLTVAAGIIALVLVLLPFIERRFDEADHISSDSPEWLAGLRGDDRVHAHNNSSLGERNNG